VTDAAAIADSAADRFGRSATRLLDIFWTIQDALGWVPPEALQALAPQLGRSVAELRDTLTFYHLFYPQPTPKRRVYVDRSALADAAGAAAVVAAFERGLGVRCDRPDADAEWALFSAPCLGLADQLPAALVDDVPLTRLDPAGVLSLCEALSRGEAPASNVTNEVQTPGPLLLRDGAPAAALLAQVAAMTPEAIVEAVTRSGLRGRGGAGFATGKKWSLAAAWPATPRYVVCNADEGEPGTFKDRYLLTERFERVLVGIIAGAKAIGAAAGVVYLRAEYRYLRAELEATLDTFRRRGWLGAGGGPAGDGFDLRIQLGAGAYVVGEETALLESLEGKRGEPRVRPPFPVERGLHGQPTIVNNVETFAAVAAIIERGADAFAAVGTDYSKGSKLLSVGGDCDRPGIHEVVWGLTIGDFLALVGAREPQFVVVGGPSGTIVAATDQERRIALEDLATGGAMMVFDRRRDLLEVVHNFTRFFHRESCGCCAPCRAGTLVFAEQLAFVRSGQAARVDLDRVAAWAGIVGAASRCGLGQTCTRPITTSLTALPDVYRGRVQEHEALFRPFDVAAKTSACEAAIRRQGGLGDGG